MFLGYIHQFLTEGGIFINASPYTWMRDYADVQDWVGGYSKDGKEHFTYDGIKAVLSEHFDEIKPPQDVEFVIRETRR
jgi:hypothetical protein